MSQDIRHHGASKVMISSFWVSLGLLIAIVTLHLFMAPPFNRLLRIPALPTNWVIGGVGMVLGIARFWLLFVPVARLSFAGKTGIFPDDWFGLAAFAFSGLLTFAIYVAWISHITGDRRNPRLASLLGPAYLLIIILQTLYVGRLVL